MKTIVDGVELHSTPICKSTESEVMYSDWRVPTIQELIALVNYNEYNPESKLGDTKLEAYWSSSLFEEDMPDVSGSIYAWVMRFSLGRGGWCVKSSPSLVRCVRDGLDGLEWSASSDVEMPWDKAIEYAENLVAPVYYKDNQWNLK